MSDEYEAEFWCRAILRIMDVPERHQEISDVLGMPTHCHAKGDPQPNNPGKPWKNSIWFREAAVPEERELHEHLAWLAEFTLPHEDFLRRLIGEGARIDIYTSYCCSEDHRGFGFDSRHLEVFVRLGMRIEVSVMT